MTKITRAKANAASYRFLESLYSHKNSYRDSEERLWKAVDDIHAAEEWAKPMDIALALASIAIPRLKTRLKRVQFPCRPNGKPMRGEDLKSHQFINQWEIVDIKYDIIDLSKCQELIQASMSK